MTRKAFQLNVNHSLVHRKCFNNQPPDVSTGGSQVNKVKLVSGLGHQMSLAGVSIQRGLGPWQGGSLCRGAMAGGRSLYSEVHYAVVVT